MHFITLAIATVALFTLSDALTQEAAEHGKRTKFRRSTLRLSSLSGADDITYGEVHKRSAQNGGQLTRLIRRVGADNKLCLRFGYIAQETIIFCNIHDLLEKTAETGKGGYINS
jgi:hypothetical protein